MTKQEILKAMATIKKGHYVNVVYKTSKVINGIACEKQTQTIVRFVEYGHIKGVDVKGKVNPNESYVDGLIYNKNTDKWYLQMATIKNDSIKAKVVYKLNGEVVDKSEYQEVDKPKANKVEMVIFRKCIDDIIKLG